MAAEESTDQQLFSAFLALTMFSLATGLQLTLLLTLDIYCIFTMVHGTGSWQVNPFPCVIDPSNEGLCSEFLSEQGEMRMSIGAYIEPARVGCIEPAKVGCIEPARVGCLQGLTKNLLEADVYRGFHRTCQGKKIRSSMVAH